jgi:hypothetical protein
MPPDVRLLERGERWLRYEVKDPDLTNPSVINAMMTAGVPIITLAEVERSLEDLYLRVVEDGEGELV